MTISVKGYAAAQRHKGGYDKWVYDMLVALAAAVAAADESADITAIEQAIGKASGEGAGGILKDIKDIKDSIGADDTADGSLKKRCKAIETAIGDEDTAASILGRIKILEDQQ